MKKLAVLLFAVCTVSLLFGQEQKEAILLSPEWAPGDSFLFYITHSQAVGPPNDLPHIVREGRAMLRVLDTLKGSQRFQWIQPNPYLMATLSWEEKRSLREDQLQKFLYQINPHDDIVRLEERERHTQQFLGYLEESIKMQKPEEDSFRIIPMLENLVAELNEPGGFELLFLKEVALLHFPLGKSFIPGDTMVYEDVFHHLLEGEPPAASRIMYLTEDQEGNFTLFKEVVLLPEDSKRVLKWMLESAGFKGEELQQKLEHSGIEIMDTHAFHFRDKTTPPAIIKASRKYLYSINGEKSYKEDIIRIERIR